jgi:hypothetical protein
MYQLDEQVQEAIERVDSFNLLPEQFSRALSEQVRLLAGSDQDVREIELAIHHHREAALRF